MTKEELFRLSRELWEPRYGPLSDEELEVMHRTVYDFWALLMEWRGERVSLDEIMQAMAEAALEPEQQGKVEGA